MTTDEKFNQIYKAIVDENVEDMELERRGARAENRHKMMKLLNETQYN